MPPCGGIQQTVAASVIGVLEPWSAEHPELIVGGNEAGMLLGGEVRAAEGAVWLRSSLGDQTAGHPRVPPLLAVEVAGQDEGERTLREKAQWYLEHGVLWVWLVLPDTREVLVMRPGGEVRCRSGARLPPCPELPGLEPPVDRFFRQLGPNA